MKALPNKIRKFLHPSFVFAVVLFAALYLSSGCDRSRVTTNSVPSPTPATEFERDLQKVRDGQYKYIYVFSRLDSAPFTSDDGTYLKTNSPLEVNARYVTDEGRRVIAGSNFTFKPEQMEALNRRFKVEDYTGK
ncbi:MAG: hypothetical protein H0V88_03020 [Pyrinomonadaceae bacterium]|nr:hypothetical protein [Pyrinomonadaceae bacterium]